MVDYTDVEHNHENERHAVIDGQVDVIPQRKDGVERGVDVDGASRCVEATEQHQVQVEQSEQSDDTSNHDGHTFRMVEPGPMQVAQRKIPIETDEDAQPTGRLSGEVAEKEKDLARGDRIPLQSESVDR